jgi:hypothetical protein
VRSCVYNKVANFSGASISLPDAENIFCGCDIILFASAIVAPSNTSAGQG